MSIVEEEYELDGDCKDEEENLQWSPFKVYNGLLTLGVRCNVNTLFSLFEDAFPNQDGEEEREYKEPSHERVGDLTSYLYKNMPCAIHNDTISTANMTSECRCKDCINGDVVCTWQALLQSFFQRKQMNLVDARWRRNFYIGLSVDAVQKGEECFAKGKECVLDILHSQDKGPVKLNHGKPDPIYRRFGKVQNGFHVSSNGVVFFSEIEAKAEERKLLSKRIESQEESDHEEEPKENQQLNKQSKTRDKGERKSGLFASLTASLSAARSGIQGLLEKSASPKESRHSSWQVPTDDNDDSEDETEKLTHIKSQVPTEDGVDNHDEFTRQMEARGGLMYESADRTVHQLSHDALPPPLSLQALQGGKSQTKQ